MKDTFVPGLPNLISEGPDKLEGSKPGGWGGSNANSTLEEPHSFLRGQAGIQCSN